MSLILAKTAPAYRKLLIFLVAFVIILCLIESVARLALRNDWVLTTTTDLSSIRWRLMWIARHTPEKTTNYNIDMFHPLLGWYPLKNASNVSIGKAIVNFNSDGIRGEKIYGKEKRPGTTRVVLVGDSFSFGEDVNDDETYSAQLESMLPDTEILNMAVHGYGLDQMMLRLNIDGFSFHPDIVLYAFTHDDLNRTVLSFRDYAKPKYELINGSLHLTNIPILPPDEFMKSFRYRPAILEMILLIRDRIKYQNNYDPTIEPLALAIWNQTSKDIQHHNAVPVFLYLPTEQEMIDSQTDQTYIEQFLFSFCDEVHITCFSARPYLANAYEQGVRYKPDSHFEPTTNRIIAEGLKVNLQKAFPEIWSQDDSTRSSTFHTEKK